MRLLINSRHPIITVETPEEERLEALLLDVATELGVPLYEWSVTVSSFWPVERQILEVPISLKTKD